MRCPKCNTEYAATVDSVTTPANEVLRKKKCPECGHVFFSVEEAVDEDTEAYVKTRLYRYRREKRGI